MVEFLQIHNRIVRWNAIKTLTQRCLFSPSHTWCVNCISRAKWVRKLFSDGLGFVFQVQRQLHPPTPGSKCPLPPLFFIHFKSDRPDDINYVVSLPISPRISNTHNHSCSEKLALLPRAINPPPLLWWGANDGFRRLSLLLESDRAFDLPEKTKLHLCLIYMLFFNYY